MSLVLVRKSLRGKRACKQQDQMASLGVQAAVARGGLHVTFQAAHSHVVRRGCFHGALLLMVDEVKDGHLQGAGINT